MCALMLIVLSACGPGQTPPVIFHKISDVKDKPTDWEGRSVRLRGRVSGLLSVPFTTIKAYELTDDSGAIYVVAESNLPSTGEQVAILGKVKNMVIVGNASMGLVVLEGRRL